jgi:hypothetical protein
MVLRGIYICSISVPNRDEIFQDAIFQSDAKPSSIKKLTISPFLGMRGCIKWIGAMPAKAKNEVRAMTVEARTAACEKGYDNRIGAMPAETRTAAHEKGSKARSEASYDEMGIKWETQYTQFERCVVMPAEGTKLYTWQRIQLSTGPGGLDAKTRKQIAENREGMVWSERRARLLDCVVQTKREYEA